MKVTVGNTLCTVSGATEAELDWLYAALTYRDPSAHYTGGSTRKPLFDHRRNEFPAGLLGAVERLAHKRGVPLEVYDPRTPPCRPVPNPHAAIRWLWAHQEEAIEACLANPHGRGIVEAPTGCHRAGTLVRMFDGSVVAVENVRPGDQLMGPDSTPRAVKRLCRGAAPMFEVTPVKGDPFFVNGAHVLTLVHTTTGRLRDVTVEEWLGWSTTQKHLHKLQRVGVEYAARSLPVDPYFLGVLLGDGSMTQSVGVTTVDPEIIAEVQAQAQVWGLYLYMDGGESKGAPTYKLTPPRGLAEKGKGRSQNRLITALRGLGVYGKTAGTKSVPFEYVTSSRTQRLALLAGLMDTDGSYAGGGYDYISKSQELAWDVATLARSVGLAAYVKECRKSSQRGAEGTYWRVSISGNTSMVPCRVPRKRASQRLQVKDVLRTGFEVRQVSLSEDYYGFELDGDHRYLLEDFTVTHNSGKGDTITGLVKIMPCRWLVIVPSGDLMHDLAARIEQHTGEKVGRWGDGHNTEGRVTVAVFKTLTLAMGVRTAAMKRRFAAFQAVIVDEVHTVAADSHWRLMMHLTGAYYRFGFSGTPLQRTDKRGALVLAALGDILFTVKAKELIELGLIAEPTVHRVFRRVKPKPGSGRDYGDAYADHIALDSERLRFTVAVASKAPSPRIVFVRLEDHGKALTAALRKAGHQVEFVDGHYSTARRKAALTRLMHRNLDTIVASKVFGTGVDAPDLQSVVLAAGGKSHIDALQNVGRGMRRRDKAGNVTKTAFPVYDITDIACGCRYEDAEGHPRYQHALCKWMDRHARERRKAYRGAGYTMVEHAP